MESTKSIKINIALSLHQQFESAANALKARGVKISFIEFSDFQINKLPIGYSLNIESNNLSIWSTFQTKGL